MNYEDMSDFEINKLVVLAIDTDGDIESVTQRKSKLKCISNQALVKLKDIDDPEPFNACNNSSDSWSIVLENKIAILPNSQGDWLSYGWSKWNGKQDFSPRKEAIDKNPLRAAMICFLKMKSAE